MKEYTREGYSWLTPGKQVVCIDDAPRPGYGHCLHPAKAGLVKRQVYTLRWVGSYTHEIGRTYIGVSLVGVQNGSDDAPFNSNRFRPLAAKTMEDDLAVFTHLLTNLPIYELAATREVQEEIVDCHGDMLNAAWAALEGK